MTVLSLPLAMAKKELSIEEKQMAERLDALLEDKDWKITDVATKLGYERTIVNKYTKGSQKISDQFLRRLEEFYHVSRKYIKTGIGPKFKTTANANEVNLNPARVQKINIDDPDSLALTRQDVDELLAPYRTDFNVSAQISRSKPNMWIVPIKVQAGFIKGFVGRTFKDQIQQIAWPFVNSECFCFEVEGLSMFPKYMPHDWLVCTILEEIDWLRKDKSYVFQTYDGIYIKQFDRIENEMMYIKSINLDYPIEPIPMSEIRVIYAIEGKYLKE